MPSMSRRRLLGGLGGSVLAGSFCDRLLVRPASAAEHPIAKRLIVIFTPDGALPRYWPPDDRTDGSFEFPNGSMLEPLAPHQDDLILIDGLDVYNAPATVSCQHAYGLGAMLTNVAQVAPYGFGAYGGDGGVGTPTNGMSIDQYVASIIGNQSRFRSLELGVQTNVGSFYTDDAYTRMCYSAPGVPVVSDDNPANVYSRLFDALTPDNRAVTARRKSLLDIAHKDLTDLRYRLATAEKAKLDLHLQAIEDIERSWTGLDLACNPPDGPDIDEYSSNAKFPDVMRAQTDLLVTAIACGMTNVATLQLSQTVSYMVMTWLGQSTDWHSLSHQYLSSDPLGDYTNGQRFFMENVAYLLERLKSFPDPDIFGGTLLDSTIVLVAHEMSDSVSHSFVKNQYILAGNAGGRWQTGQYYDLDGHNHGELLVSICQAMGIDIDTFGDPASGSGGLGVLS
jgi:hypothetical protein